MDNISTKRISDYPVIDSPLANDIIPTVHTDETGKRVNRNITFARLTSDAQGPTGPVGPAGPQGDTGADSTVAGPKGDIGNTGPQGPKGDKGDKGNTGNIGPAGADSVVPGPKGDTGEPGVDGADSTVPGPKGDKGPAGLKGDEGPIGADGPQGGTGPKGDKGDDGADGTGVNILGSLNNTGELPPTGNPGDAYMVGGNLWVWSSTTSSWEDAGDIKGPKGDAGAAGADGSDGARGPAGNDGIQGPKGDDGVTPVKGIDYTDGAKGDRGATGATGADSTVPGPKGDKGEPGAKGDNGDPATNLVTSVAGKQGVVTLGASDLTATGRNSAKYLRGDNTWQTVSAKAPYVAQPGTPSVDDRDIFWVDTDDDDSWEFGDMEASTYDPTGKVGDAFSMNNMTETSTKKVMTSSERAKLAAVNREAIGQYTIGLTGARVSPDLGFSPKIIEFDVIYVQGVNVGGTGGSAKGFYNSSTGETYSHWSSGRAVKGGGGGFSDTCPYHHVLIGASGDGVNGLDGGITVTGNRFTLNITVKGGSGTYSVIWKARG